MRRYRPVFAVFLASALSVPAWAGDAFDDRLFLKFGGMRPGSGIAGGLEYRDSHFGNGIADLRLESKVSIRLYQRHELELVFPHVSDPRLFVEVLALYRSQTQIDYFGLGPDSSDEDRTNYRLDGMAGFGTVGFRLQRNLQFGGRAGYVQSKLRSGTDGSHPSLEERFDPSQAPGLEDSPDHLTLGGFFFFDFRDDEDDPSRGGLMEVQTVRYMDTGPGRYSFDELGVEAQYFVPAGRRATVGLRLRSVLTRPHAGHEIPFYLLPSLGGSDYLHSFENDRFRDRHSLVVNHELRYRATPAIRLELFVDAGQVAPELGGFSLSGLELSYGGGVRYKLGSSVLAGVSIGFGREGSRVSFNGNFRF